MLDHFRDIDALALDGVEPMTQPYQLVNVLRARRRAACLDRDEVLAEAPEAEDGRFRVPPIRGGAVTALEIAAAVRSALGRDVGRGRRGAPRPHRRAGPRAARLQPRAGRRGPRPRRARSTPRSPPADDPGPLAGVPVALKDNLCTRGIPTTCSSKILAGWRPPYDATVVERLRAAGAVVDRQDQPRRVRHGLVHRELGLRADQAPAGPDARAGRVVGRERGRRGRRLRAPRRSARTPAARSASPRRCAASSASSRPTAR